MTNPPGMVHTQRDERLWKDAKAAVTHQYGSPRKLGDRYWALVNNIYHRMRTRTGGARYNPEGPPTMNPPRRRRAPKEDQLLSMAESLLTPLAAGKAILLVGPPGSGKTILARRIAVALGRVVDARELEWAVAIWNAAGLIGHHQSWEAGVPFRAPHYTASRAAFTGTARKARESSFGSPFDWARPGELSLAHGGLLYLDEAPEFQRQCLEATEEAHRYGEIGVWVPQLKQQGREGAVHLPTRFALVMGANLCPCGHRGTSQACSCTDGQAAHYLERVTRSISNVAVYEVG